MNFAISSRVKKQKFDRIFEYLTENDLNSEAKFKPSLWSSYTEISDFENFDNSTNFVESLNFVLKKFVPRGTVSFKKGDDFSFQNLRNFTETPSHEKWWYA